MIVDTMSLDEIVLELKKDEAFLERQKNEMVKKDIKTLKAKGIKEFPYNYTREVVSNRKNRYIMRFEVLERSALKNPNEISYAGMALSEKPGKGLYVYALLGGRDTGSLVEYKPHFFHRYAERSGFEGSPVQVIRHYFVHNSYEMTTTALVNGLVYTASATEEGVAFGDKEDGHHHVRTFVTYDLLFYSQKHFQEALMAPIRIRNRYYTNKYDKENNKLLVEKTLSMVQDYDKAFVGLWKAYAKRNLKMNAVVHRIEEGHFELIDKDKVDEIPVDAPLSHGFFATNDNATKAKPSLIESPVKSIKKKLSGKRVTPATIFRRKNK